MNNNFNFYYKKNFLKIIKMAKIEDDIYLNKQNYGNVKNFKRTEELST